ncbi:MAG: Bifunctional homocysteine S-methyltransferase/5,10-methylenetetrahydrofolate reductase [Phycisphaerae bacterium]|nr:Bifunctional homocysteine S-methyltransferase/5,10-methylenetetrahydrofolate reductase [Phycisphaerae bacterium]
MALDVESLARRVHVADGAWSTILAARCPGEARRTEMLALTQPQATAGLIEQYLAAGAELITTHTFGVTPGNLKRWEVQSELAEVIAGICAVFRRQVPGKRAALLGDIGPSGKILAVREAPEAELAAMYRAQAAALAAGGVDAILLETFSELAEILLALRAVREVTALPVIASMSFDSGPQRTRTIMGAEAGQCAAALEEAGAEVIGCNCGAGIGSILPAVVAMRAATRRALWVKPNAGLPELEEGRAVYRTTPEEYAAHVPTLIDAGANVIGGCCGVGPEHIRRVSEVVRKWAGRRSGGSLR